MFVKKKFNFNRRFLYVLSDNSFYVVHWGQLFIDVVHSMLFIEDNIPPPPPPPPPPHTHTHTQGRFWPMWMSLNKAVNMVKRLEITKSLSVDTPKKGFAEWSLRGKLHYAFFQEKRMDTKLCLHLLTNTVVLPYMAFDPSPKKNMLQPCYNLSGFFLFLFFVFSR